MMTKSSTATDDFARYRFLYVSSALGDPRLTHLTARLVAHLGLRYANREEYERNGQLTAFPGQARLAEELGCTPDGVRKAANCAQRAGYLDITPGRGRGNSTVYVLTLPAKESQTVVRLFPTKSQTGSGGFRGSKSQTDRLKKPREDRPKSQTDPASNLMKEPSEETHKGARRTNAFDQLLRILPERLVKISNLKRAQALWGPKVALHGADRLLAAARAYAVDPAIAKQNHLPSLQTWLFDDLFLQFLPDASAAPRPISNVWQGPAEIREVVLRAGDSGKVASYLDPARWDADRRCVVCGSRWAFDWLRKNVGRQLAAMKVDLEGPPPAAAGA